MLFKQFINVPQINGGKYLVVYPNGNVVLCWFSVKYWQFCPEEDHERIHEDEFVPTQMGSLRPHDGTLVMKVEVESE